MAWVDGHPTRVVYTMLGFYFVEHDLHPRFGVLCIVRTFCRTS